MDGFRKYYDAPFGGPVFDRTILDRLSNTCSDLLVRTTRANTWDHAMLVWTASDRDKARERMLDELGATTSLLQRALLLPLL